MSDNVSKDKPLSGFERILTSGAALSTIAAGLPGVILLLKGNSGFTTLILLISGITTLWLGCLYVYRRKVITGKSLGLEHT